MTIKTVRRANGTAAEYTFVLVCVYNELPDALAAYFRNLATLVDHNYDSNFFNLINKQYSSINKGCPSGRIHTIFVRVMVLYFKLNKAAGHDIINPEHSRYGGNLLINALTQIFNAIIASGHIPAAFRCGLVITIPKRQSKDLTSPTNYRGIIILSNISKVLVKLISKRITEL